VGATLGPESPDVETPIECITLFALAYAKAGSWYGMTCKEYGLDVIFAGWTSTGRRSSGDGWTGWK
jgi:hypothetical protein